MTSAWLVLLCDEMATGGGRPPCVILSRCTPGSSDCREATGWCVRA